MARVNRVKDDETKITRRMFEECFEELVSKTDLDILYKEFNCQCKIKRLQLSKVCILRGGETPEIRTVLNLIAAEEDEEFVKWVDAIQTSLSNTSNQKCSHGSIVNKMMQIRMDLTTSSTNTWRSSTKFQPNPGRKWIGASMTASQVVRQRQFSPTFSLLDIGRIEKVLHKHSAAIDLKIITAGGSGAGKSCFLSCYNGKGFQTSLPTVGCQHIPTVYYFYNDVPIQVTFLDTAGQERFDSMVKVYYRNSSGAMIFVDLDQIYNDDCTLSIDRAKRSFDRLKEVNDNPICLLVGAKYDLVRNFSDKAKQSIDTLARRVSGENWVYTSAKKNLNLEKAVYMMIELIMRQQQNNSRFDNSVRVLPFASPCQVHEPQNQPRKCFNC
ncbi:uncharacterized protein [Dysidea avara]|uniref:uncharacterized protein isoform X1 n=1 Tax=Dysidea avara TaxID=196820 RepID=UPI00332137E9